MLLHILHESTCAPSTSIPVTWSTLKQLRYSYTHPHHLHPTSITPTVVIFASPISLTFNKSSKYSLNYSSLNSPFIFQSACFNKWIGYLISFLKFHSKSLFSFTEQHNQIYSHFQVCIHFKITPVPHFLRELCSKKHLQKAGNLINLIICIHIPYLINLIICKPNLF